MSSHTMFFAFDKSPLPKVTTAEVNDRVKAYLKASTSEATLKAYKTDIQHFLAWGGELPANEVMIANFIADISESYSVATIQRRLAAISKFHQSAGLANPALSALVRTTMRGIRRKKGMQQRQVKPITKEILFQLIETCEEDLPGARDAALLLLGFAGAFRRSELVGLDVGDLEFVDEGLVATIRRSKSDQEGFGRKVGIPFGKATVCPVSALQCYLEQGNLDAGPLFRPLSKEGLLRKRRLTTAGVALTIKKRVTQVGLDPENYSGHSLRAGFATSAAMAGMPSWAIMKRTGHRSQATLQRYIRDGSLFMKNSPDRLF